MRHLEFCKKKLELKTYLLSGNGITCRHAWFLDSKEKEEIKENKFFKINKFDGIFEKQSWLRP
jgi:hypothetical protein